MLILLNSMFELNSWFRLLYSTNRLISFNATWSFGQMLVVLHTKLAFFIKFLVHAWSRHGGLNKEFFLCWFPKGQSSHFNTRLKWDWCWNFFVQTSTLNPSMHQTFTEHGKFACKTTNSQPNLQLHKRNNFLNNTSFRGSLKHFRGLGPLFV